MVQAKLGLHWSVDYNVHYNLDDFLVMGAAGSDECAVALRGLLDTFEILGLPVALDKLEGPDTTDVSGVRAGLQGVRDSATTQEAGRVERVNSAVAGGTMKDLESLVGKLGHAAQVVQPGRTFLRQKFELKAAVRHVKGKFRLNAPMCCGGRHFWNPGMAPA